MRRKLFLIVSLFCLFGLSCNMGDKNYEIEYDLQGGYFEVDAKVPTSYIENATISLPTPHKEDYIFTGWVDQEENNITNTEGKTGKLKLTATFETLYKEVTYVISNLQVSQKVRKGDYLPFVEFYDWIGENLCYGLFTEYEGAPIGTTYKVESDMTITAKEYAIYEVTQADIEGEYTISNVLSHSKHVVIKGYQDENICVNQFNCRFDDSLESIRVGKEFTIINHFSNYPYLKEVILEDGITTLGMLAFNQCPELETVILPTTLSLMANRAFYNCTGLEYIYIPMQALQPSGGVSNYKEVFLGCMNLRIEYEGSTSEQFVLGYEEGKPIYAPIQYNVTK